MYVLCTRSALACLRDLPSIEFAVNQLNNAFVYAQIRFPTSQPNSRKSVLFNGFCWRLPLPMHAAAWLKILETRESRTVAVKTTTAIAADWKVNTRYTELYCFFCLLLLYYFYPYAHTLKQKKNLKIICGFHNILFNFVLFFLFFLYYYNIILFYIISIKIFIL